MKFKLFIIATLLFTLFSCESEQKKQQRVAQDNYIYQTFEPSIFHIDKNCKKLKKSESYQIYSKRELVIADDNITTGFKGRWTVLTFCTECTKTQDIEKLRSQINFYNAR